jgi:hypothetical protein
VRQTLRQWQRDPDLAGVRDAAGVGLLPADQQRTGRMFWEEVAAVLKMAQGDGVQP